MTKPKTPTPAQAHKLRKARGWKAWNIHEWFPTADVYVGSKRSRKHGFLSRLWNKMRKWMERKAKEKRTLSELRQTKKNAKKENPLEQMRKKSVDKSFRHIRNQHRG